MVLYKDLFWQLTLREIKARYKQSILGYAWAILVPLINLLVLSVVFTYIFRVPTGSTPYAVFLFVALIPWMFLVSSLTSATGSVMANSALITKVKIPREILPLSAISSKLVDLILASVLLVAFLYFYQVPFHITTVFIPVIFLVQFFLILGICLILSATNVFYRDVENILGVFLTIWMYMSPVLYPSNLIPENFKLFFFLNPMTGIINAYRDAILYGRFTDTYGFIYSATFSLFILLVGIIYFKNRSRFFADVM